MPLRQLRLSSSDTQFLDPGQTTTSENIPKIWLKITTLEKRFFNKSRRLLKGPSKLILYCQPQNLIVSYPAKTRNRKNINVPLSTSFRVLVAESSYIGKTDHVHSHDLKNTAHVKPQKFIPINNSCEELSIH